MGRLVPPSGVFYVFIYPYLEALLVLSADVTMPNIFALGRNKTAFVLLRLH